MVGRIDKIVVSFQELEDWIIEHKHDEILDLTRFDVSRLSHMIGLFYSCDAREINVSNWDVSNVEDMSHMFTHCSSLAYIDVSNWDVSKVENMRSLFLGCEHLQSLDISNWDVSNVRDMGCMFNYCSALTSIDISNWDVSNVRDMGHMFSYCHRLQNLNH